MLYQTKQATNLYELKAGEDGMTSEFMERTSRNSTFGNSTRVLDSQNDYESENQVKRVNRNRIIQSAVDLVVIVIIFVIFILVYVLFYPKVRYMTCEEWEIFMPYKPDTIPFWAVGIYATIGPILFIVGIELINARLLPCQKNTYGLTPRARSRKFFICTFHALSLFVLGIALTLCLTEIGKRWVGRLRPHFIAVCQPDFTKVQCTSPAAQGYVYVAINTADPFCTGDPALVKEARMSFPSGHSSYSSYCMLFLIIYVEARLILLKFRYIKPLIQLAAFSAAFVTALSRISDYHHRGTDVLGGASLGILIALFVGLVVGRVLWNYEVEKRYFDFDQKPISRQF